MVVDTADSCVSLHGTPWTLPNMADARLLEIIYPSESPSLKSKTHFPYTLSVLTLSVLTVVSTVVYVTWFHPTSVMMLSRQQAGTQSYFPHAKKYMALTRWMQSVAILYTAAYAILVRLGDLPWNRGSPAWYRDDLQDVDTLHLTYLHWWKIL